MGSSTGHDDFTSGLFVISLDFELLWGVRDKKTIENYGTNIIGVREAIPALLHLFNQYKIKATFSTVGFLFAENKGELLQYIPQKLPEYDDKRLSPYNDIDSIGNDEKDDPYHFGNSLFKMILESKEHEIGTHTYCHYYCMEKGQDIESFREDLRMAKKIAIDKSVVIRSLVFPRNQFNEEYLHICREAGIDSYRANPRSWLYQQRVENDETLFRRSIRFIDAYINLTGHHCHSKGSAGKLAPFNLAGSRFLRPYSKKTAVLDFLRLARIKNAMRHAAKNNKLFHLWWHPHNFGINLQDNIRFLEQILKYYQLLNKKYGFKSKTMTGVVDEELLKGV